MSNTQYIQPELKTYSFAVSDYFTRDIRDKNAAAIAMAMSQLDQNDLWQFTERLFIETKKYEDVEIRNLVEELKSLYYGDGKIPHWDEHPVPFFYLKADSFVQVESENLVRIRGLVIDGIVQEMIPWSNWQQLKSESSRALMDVAAEIIAKIDAINNFSANLAESLSLIEKDISSSREIFDCDVKGMVSTGYMEKGGRDLSNQVDAMTFKRDSPNADNRKYKIFSKDYGLNLQTMISQVFNSNGASEAMYHLSKVVTYVSNTIETQAPKGNVFYVRPKEDLATPFLRLVQHYQFLSDVSNNHQYMTSDERLAVYRTLHSAHAALLFIQGKILSLVNYIMTVLPKRKTSNFGRADW